MTRALSARLYPKRASAFQLVRGDPRLRRCAQLRGELTVPTARAPNHALATLDLLLISVGGNEGDLTSDPLHPSLWN